MSYGLRRYETIHRLWWFVFFIVCLFLAGYSRSFTHVSRQAPELKDLKKTDFWTGLQGINMTSPVPERTMGKERSGQGARPEPGISAGQGPGKPPFEPSAGKDESVDNIAMISATLLFLIRAGIIFLELRLVWLLVQYAGRYLLQIFMSESGDLKTISPAPPRAGKDSLFPIQGLVEKIRRSPLSFVLHPFIRIRLMLAGFQKNIPSEDLVEKERRVVEADWQILYGSWGPYRVLFWLLPVLGLAQTVLLLAAQFNMTSAALALIPQKDTFDAVKPMFQKEILDAVKPTLNLLLPLIQAAGAAIFFQLASTFVRYFEELYLSNLDSFIYDRLLSRLPLRSNDTILILEALQGQFRDFHAALKRLENKVLAQTEGEKQP
jgi:hypothetical protein